MLQCDLEFDLRDIASSVVSNDTPNFSLIGPAVSEWHLEWRQSIAIRGQLITKQEPLPATAQWAVAGSGRFDQFSPRPRSISFDLGGLS